MAQQIINNKFSGETGLSSRNKINSNFTEIYNYIGQQPAASNEIFLYKGECEYEYGWVKIQLDNWVNNKKITNITCVIDTDNGLTQVDIIISMPSTTQYTTSSFPVSMFKGFYIKDVNGLIEEYSNFKSIYLSFNIKDNLDSELITYDIQDEFVGGNNIILSDNTLNHTNVLITALSTLNPTFDTNRIIKSVTDSDLILSGNTVIGPYPFKVNYCNNNNSDIVAEPISGSLLWNAKKTNPKILCVCPHYNNTITQEYDNELTSDDSFYEGVIGVGWYNTTDNYHGSYGRGMEFSIIDSISWSESFASLAIATYLKQIKDATNADWNTVRLAARATASQANSWDKYKGFGEINVNDAISYIQNNIPTRSIAIGKQYSYSKGYLSDLQLSDINDNTPLPKKYSQEKLESGINIKTINEQSLLGSGDLTIEPPSGGYSNNLYYTNADSDVGGYKVLSYTPDIAETEIITSVINTDGNKLIKTFLYPSQVSVDLFPAGLWAFNINAKVANGTGITQIGATYFRRLIDTSEVDLFTVWSNEINNTDYDFVNLLMTNPSFSVNTTDRMGCRLLVKTTRSSATNVTIRIGDGYSSYLSNPNKIRHSQLRAFNEDANYRHITQTEYENKISNLKHGDIAGGHYFEVLSDGTIKLNGSATAFDDLTADITRAKTIGTRVSFNDVEQTLDFTSSATTADYIVVSYQLAHRWKAGSRILPHIHWEQEYDAVPNFLLQYRWQKNLGIKKTAWTNYKCNTLATTYTSGTLNQICFDSGITPPVGYSLSDIIQIRVIRDTNNTSTLFTGSDGYTGTVRITAVDIHYEIDSIGSSTEYTK